MSSKSMSDGASAIGLEETGPRKTASHYFRALRRRFWLVMLLTILLGGGATLFTLFVQKPVYLANAVIRIEPPKSLVEGLSTNMNTAAEKTMAARGQWRRHPKPAMASPPASRCA